MPPAAGWDTENVQVYEEGSAVAPTTWTNAAWRIVVPFGVFTTRVHPAGGVMVGLPRTPIAATRTSPCCTPAGTGIESVVAPFVNAEAAERNSIGAATGTTSRSTVAGALKASPSLTRYVNWSGPL